MNQSYTKRERQHIEAVKSLQCSICDAPAPSEAHHIDQADPWTCIALCEHCHRHPKDGHHGQKAMWKVMHMTELNALGVTIKRLMA